MLLVLCYCLCYAGNQLSFKDEHYHNSKEVSHCSFSLSLEWLPVLNLKMFLSQKQKRKLITCTTIYQSCESLFCLFVRAGEGLEFNGRSYYDIPSVYEGSNGAVFFSFPE